MNKQELVSAMAIKSSLTKKDSESALKAFEEVVMEELAKGGEIKLTGFLGFSVVETAERKARNPKDGTEVTVPAGRKPKCKFGKPFKDSLK